VTDSSRNRRPDAPKRRTTRRRLFVLAALGVVGITSRRVADGKTCHRPRKPRRRRYGEASAPRKSSKDTPSVTGDRFWLGPWFPRESSREIPVPADCPLIFLPRPDKAWVRMRWRCMWAARREPLAWMSIERT
jgi:hypothetical protein